MHIKDAATILTCKCQQKVRSSVHCKILYASIDCSIHVEQTYQTFVYKFMFLAHLINVSTFQYYIILW